MLCIIPYNTINIFLITLSEFYLDRFKKGYRKDFIKEFLTQIKHSESFLIVGMPGLGKHDLFQTFEEKENFWQKLYPDYKNNFLIVFIDLSKLLKSTPIYFYKLLLDRLCKVILKNIKNDQEIEEITKKSHTESLDKNDLFAIFSIIEDLLEFITKNKDYSVCFIFHDFAQLNKFDKQFFNSLRALHNINSWNICLAFSSDQDILYVYNREIVDDLYGLFFTNQINLKLFTKKEAYIIMEEWEKDLNYKIPSKVKLRIYELSLGNLSYMKSLHNIYQEPNQNKELLNKDNFKKLVKLNTIKVKNEKFWKALSIKDQDILKEFIKNKEMKFKTKGQYLLKTQIITEINKKKKVFSPLLENYIKYDLIQQTKKINTITKERIFVDIRNKLVYKDSLPLTKEPTPSEYKILELLYKNKGKVVSRDELARAIWGNHLIEKYSDWAIDRTISRIRKKIGDSAKNPKFILTIKGRGLKLIQ